MSNRKQIESLELTVSKNTDAFKVEAFLERYEGIEAVEVVTCSVIRIKYNALKIAAKVVLKLVQQSSQQGHRNRKRNIQSIRSIQNF